MTEAQRRETTSELLRLFSSTTVINLMITICFPIFHLRPRMPLVAASVPVRVPSHVPCIMPSVHLLIFLAAFRLFPGIEKESQIGEGRIFPR